MANLGTATIPVIPSTTINIPRPGIKYTGSNDTTTGNTLTPGSGNFNQVNVGDTVYKTTGTDTIGIVTALNYTGDNITTLTTDGITWADEDVYEIYTSYTSSLVPPASSTRAVILENQGNGRLGIYSASAGAITGIDSEGNTFSYTAVAGATLPFFVARVNTSAGATQLVAFIDND